MQNRIYQAIILAGGRGTRMQSTNTNKVMREIAGKPMLDYPVSALEKLDKELKLGKPIAVVGFAQESIRSYFGERLIYAEQKEALGTADAVRAAVPYIRPETTDVFVLYGDHSTFYTADFLRGLAEAHVQKEAAMTLVTTHTNPAGYGRILRDAQGRMIGIVEEKVASEEQKKITEISTGNAIYSTAFLNTYLPQIQMNPVSKEYYFTDIVELAVRNNERLEAYVADDETIGMGVNTPDQLIIAQQAMNSRN